MLEASGFELSRLTQRKQNLTFGREKVLFVFHEANKLTRLAFVCVGISSANAALTYFDAPAVNTTVGDVTFTGISGGWTERINGPAANAFNTTSQQGSGAASATVTGSMSFANLAASSTYTDVRIYYIGKDANANGNNWDFSYSYSGGSGLVRDEIDGTNVDLSNGGIGAPASVTGDIRYMVSVADFTTDASGGITFTFQRPDFHRDGVTGSNDRFVIDGIAFDTTPIPEPSTAFLAIFSGAFLLRRKR